MVVGQDGIEHRTFHELPSLLRSGDLLVLNETRVIAARIFGRRCVVDGAGVPQGGGRVEVLLLHPAGSLQYDPRALRWTALVRPARRLHAGTSIVFASEDAQAPLGSAEIVGQDGPNGMRELAFDLKLPFEEFLARAGRLALPPYIHNDSDEAQARYQTVFARTPGSVAAPTASLHFTPEILERLRAGGIEIVRLSLDVGLGTFFPMKAKRLDEHHMHAEGFAIGADVARAVLHAKREGRRVVAAGTTVVRALEGSAAKHGRVVAGRDDTDIFIRPGFEFQVVDALITNFHLPQSTLLVLVSALAGRERILSAYREAVAERYRFFSFGDAMFLTRDSSKGFGY